MSEQSPKRAPRAKRAPKSPAVAPEAAASSPSLGAAREAAGEGAPQKRKAAKAKLDGVNAPAAAANMAAPAKPAAPKAAPRKKSVAAAPGGKPAVKKAAPKTPPKAAKRVPSTPPSAPAESVVHVEAVTAVPEPAAEATSPAVSTAKPGTPLSVLLVASEAAPFARTGDLADLVGGAANALGALGHRVTLVLPKYAGVVAPSAPVDRFTVDLGASTEEATCYEVPLGTNVRAILVEHAGFFGREFLYGDGQDDYGDNPRRFAFLSKAALEFAAREGERVDVVQAFDWQTGLVPVYLGVDYRRHPALARALSVFTIHNVAFQGLCSPDWLLMLGLDRGLFSPDGLEYWGRVSLLKGGVNFADLVSTLEAEYQEALLTPGHGAGFEGVLASRGEAFRSVLNGDAQGATREDAAYLAERLSRFYARGLAARSAESAG